MRKEKFLPGEIEADALIDHLSCLLFTEIEEKAKDFRWNNYIDSDLEHLEDHSSWRSITCPPEMMVNLGILTEHEKDYLNKEIEDFRFNMNNEEDCDEEALREEYLVTLKIKITPDADNNWHLAMRIDNNQPFLTTDIACNDMKNINKEVFCEKMISHDAENNHMPTM